MQSVRYELRRLSQLALPVTLGNLASMLLQVVDTAMVAQVSVEALGAASLGRTYIFTTMLFGLGLVLGMEPIAARAHGAGNDRMLRRALIDGLWMATAASLPLGLTWLATEEFLIAAGQDPAVAAVAETYALVQLPGLLFFLLFVALRHYLHAQGLMAPAMWISFLANGVNIFANWVLIFGKLGFPALGVKGAGISTAITEAFMVGTLAWYVFRKAPPKHQGTLPKTRIREVLALGLPTAVQISLEVLAFSTALVLAGRLGLNPLAAHSIAINMAAVSFMLPLGVSFATVTRVGNLLGAEDYQGAQRAAWVSIGLGGGVMLFFAVLFVAGRWALPRLYTDNLEVIALCAAVLPIAAAFQLFDGLQACGAGVLRGMGKTVPAAVFNFLGYYLLALPLGAWMAFHLEWGLAGLWWGLAIGLATVSVLLIAYIARRGPGTQQPLIARTEETETS